jgi:CPA1 family monovalent cation:H+ antiporter
VSGAITRSLLAVAARLQDGIKTGGVAGYVQAAEAALAFPMRFRLALALHRRFRFERVLAAEIANRFEILLMLQAALGKLGELAQRKLPALIGPEAAEEVRALMAARLDSVEKALAALRLQYADFSRALQLQYLERAAVRIEEAEYRRLRSEAVIGHEVYNDLQSDLRERAHRLDRRPPIDLQLTPEAMVARVPPFAGLTPGQLSAITRLLRPLLAVPGEPIVRKGEVGDAMYFIASGAVEVQIGANPVRLGSGDFFGELALITRARRNADVVSLGFCSLLVLQAQDFDALLKTSPDLKNHIHEIARKRLGKTQAPA